MKFDEDWTPPQTGEAMATWVDGLTFHPEIPVAEEDMPPRFDPIEDELLTRSFKLPRRLDKALQQIADERGVTKSDVIRQALEVAVGADLASKGEDVLVPMSEVLRALSQVRGLPRSA
jgi:hypothetical protein